MPSLSVTYGVLVAIVAKELRIEGRRGYDAVKRANEARAKTGLFKGTEEQARGILVLARQYRPTSMTSGVVCLRREYGRLVGIYGALNTKESRLYVFYRTARASLYPSWVCFRRNLPFLTQGRGCWTVYLLVPRIYTNYHAAPGMISSWCCLTASEAMQRVSKYLDVAVLSAGDSNPNSQRFLC